MKKRIILHIMKKYILTTVVVGTVCIIALSGCGRDSKKHSAPSARNQLVVRLFQSMDGKDYTAAAGQARKLQALDPGNLYLDVIISRQQGNLCVAEAQKQIDAGDFDGAVVTLDDGVRNAPLNQHLKRTLEQIRKLAVLNKAVEAFRAAETPEERGVALTRVELAVETLKMPKLNAEIAAQRKALIAEMDQKRKKAAESAETK